MERIIREKPDVAFRFVQAIGSRLTELESRLEDMAFKSIPARLAGLLLHLTHLTEEKHEEDVCGYTHQDFAELLGTYRETTTQTLNEFKAAGLVNIGRKRVMILSREGLRRIAEE